MAAENDEQISEQEKVIIKVLFYLFITICYHKRSVNRNLLSFYRDEMIWETNYTKQNIEIIKPTYILTQVFNLECFKIYF